MRKFFGLLVLILIILSGCVGKETQNDSSKILKLASWLPSKHYIASANSNWIKEVNKNAAGKIKIIEYPEGKLYGPKNMHTAISKGSVDIGLTLQPLMIQMCPILQGVSLPFFFDNLDQTFAAYAGESLSILEKGLEKKNIKLIYACFTDSLQFFSNKQNIKKIEDFEGLKILSHNPIFSDIFANLGMTPETLIPFRQQYMSIKNDTCNATVNSISGGYFQRTFEVAPYVTKMDVGFPTIFVCMNLSKWNELPIEVQQVMINLGKKYSERTLLEAQGWEQKVTNNALSKYNTAITRLPKLERDKIKKKSRKVWDKWAEQNGKEAQMLLKVNRNL